MQDTPNYFVGIGAQKAGTTWLHDQLSRHPEIALPRHKELHYFDSLGLTRSGQSYARNVIGAAKGALRQARPGQVEILLDLLAMYLGGDTAYRNYLHQTTSASTRVIGEITPGYATLSSAGFAAIEAALKPKVIFIMRDPLERYWSFVRMMENDDNQLESRFEAALHDPAVWDRCDYEATIRLVEATFPSDRVLFLFYENLVSETSLETIADFLGVAPRWNWNLEHRALVGRELKMPKPAVSVLERFKPVYQYVDQRFPGTVPESWADVR